VDTLVFATKRASSECCLLHLARRESAAQRRTQLGRGHDQNTINFCLILVEIYRKFKPFPQRRMSSSDPLPTESILLSSQVPRPSSKGNEKWKKAGSHEKKKGESAPSSGLGSLLDRLNFWENSLKTPYRETRMDNKSVRRTLPRRDGCQKKIHHV